MKYYTIVNEHNHTLSRRTLTGPFDMDPSPLAPFAVSFREKRDADRCAVMAAQLFHMPMTVKSNEVTL